MGIKVPEFRCVNYEFRLLTLMDRTKNIQGTYLCIQDFYDMDYSKITNLNNIEAYNITVNFIQIF